LIEIRTGKYSLREIQELGVQLESEALTAAAGSPLPDSVDREAISSLLADVHPQFWSTRPLVCDLNGVSIISSEGANFPVPRLPDELSRKFCLRA